MADTEEIIIRKQGKEKPSKYIPENFKLTQSDLEYIEIFSKYSSVAESSVEASADRFKYLNHDMIDYIAALLSFTVTILKKGKDEIFSKAEIEAFVKQYGVREEYDGEVRTLIADRIHPDFILDVWRYYNIFIECMKKKKREFNIDVTLKSAVMDKPSDLMSKMKKAGLTGL